MRLDLFLCEVQLENTANLRSGSNNFDIRPPISEIGITRPYVRNESKKKRSQTKGLDVRLHFTFVRCSPPQVTAHPTRVCDCCFHRHMSLFGIRCLLTAVAFCCAGDDGAPIAQIGKFGEREREARGASASSSSWPAEIIALQDACSKICSKVAAQKFKSHTLRTSPLPTRCSWLLGDLRDHHNTILERRMRPRRCPAHSHQAARDAPLPPPLRLTAS